ncbi:hypothetical protein [Paenalcaligenes faecalis]|uniref:hypothetical protein n=1 Tax=Paenalcaligenes faecalis TaxID=2980099 RepID=UPI003D9C725C
MAFANEPGLDGGYLLLGVDWSVNNKGDTVYIPAGLVDPDKIQHISRCTGLILVLCPMLVWRISTLKLLSFIVVKERV